MVHKLRTVLQLSRDAPQQLAYLLLVQLQGGLDQVSQGSELLLLLILCLLYLLGGRHTAHMAAYDSSLIILY